MGERICGRLASGMGQGRHFTRLAWARAAFIDLLGIDPFPGTLNIVLDDPKQQALWARLKSEPGVRLLNSDHGPGACDARCYPVLVNGGVAAAIVVPEVPGYPPDVIEIIADANLREALAMADGDIVCVTVA
jgi:CTP-dependent riboflavin kinase